MARILNDGPWHIFNDLILIEKPNPMQPVATMKFTEITMWAQVHNLPLACMNKRIVSKIGENIGRVVEVDAGEGDRCGGKIARVQIIRSINEPLVRGILVEADGGGNTTIVLVLYEKLPDLFCFACGKIGHHLKNCVGTDNVKTKPAFGSWLKASRGVDRKNGLHNDTRFTPRAHPNGPRPPHRGHVEEGLTTTRVLTTGLENERKETIEDD